MNRLYSFWLHFLRMWLVIDLTAAQQLGNHCTTYDCRCRINDLDAEIDRLRVLA